MSEAALLALAAALLFAIALILTQYGLRTIPSWRSPLYSIGGSAAAAVLLASIFVDWTAFDLRAAAIFAGVGLVYPVVSSILSVRANEKLGPAIAGALGNVTPLFAVLGAVLFLGERLGPGRLLGVAMVVGGVALLALRRGGAGRRWPLWAIGLPLVAALVRGSIQPAIKTGLGFWPEPMAAAAISYVMSTLMIVLLVGRRARSAGPADTRGMLWFTVVGLCNGGATFLLYAALGLGSIAIVAPLVALFPLIAIVLAFVFLRGERLHAIGLLGIAVSVAGVILLLTGG
jgi:drug/metabolite transporter (DMT)-like permease